MDYRHEAIPAGRPVGRIFRNIECIENLRIGQFTVSIDNPEVIDIVTKDPSGRFAILILVDDQPWDSGDHLDKLGKKVGAYLHFIVSGEFFNQYPHLHGRQPKILVAHAHEPDADARKYLALVETIVEGQGCSFQCDDIKSASELREKTTPNLPDTGRPWWKIF